MRSLHSAARYLAAKLHFKHLNFMGYHVCRLYWSWYNSTESDVYTNLMCKCTKPDQHPSNRKLKSSNYVGCCKHRAISEDKLFAPLLFGIKMRKEITGKERILTGERQHVFVSLTSLKTQNFSHHISNVQF